MDLRRQVHTDIQRTNKFAITEYHKMGPNDRFSQIFKPTLIGMYDGYIYVYIYNLGNVLGAKKNM